MNRYSPYRGRQGDHWSSYHPIMCGVNL